MAWPEETDWNNVITQELQGLEDHLARCHTWRTQRTTEFEKGRAVLKHFIAVYKAKIAIGR